MYDNRRKKMIIAVGAVVLVLIAGALIAVRGNNHAKDPLQQQQEKFDKTATADPILNYLPYGDLGYNIVPTFMDKDGKRILVLNVSVILAGADYKLPAAALDKLIAQREQDALSYIKSSGFDTNKYTISYEVPAH
ncbi:MAG: hypothetical protein JWO96_104 [Candidatus Saccharibacteria bacterium]|nr:hypothetical protein [Candidatus Saccharibacteria bacterium]